jgi:hypothetical protein
MGFMHATPGEMKSFRSSAERMALMVSCGGGGASNKYHNSDRRRWEAKEEEAQQAVEAKRQEIWQRKDKHDIFLHCLRNPCRIAEKCYDIWVAAAMRPPIDKLPFLSLPSHVRGDLFPNSATCSTPSLMHDTCASLVFTRFSRVLSETSTCPSHTLYTDTIFVGCMQRTVD